MGSRRGPFYPSVCAIIQERVAGLALVVILRRLDEGSGVETMLVSFAAPNLPRFFAESILSEAEGLRMTSRHVLILCC